MCYDELSKHTSVMKYSELSDQVGGVKGSINSQGFWDNKHRFSKGSNGQLKIQEHITNHEIRAGVSAY